MKKLLFIVLFLIAVPSYALSYKDTHRIYNKLVVDNYLINAPPLFILDTPEANAYSTRKATYITTSMIKYVKNEDEMARVLGHELGHFTLRHRRSTIANEFAADQMAIIYMAKSGFNRCTGAQLLLRRNNPVSSDHPADVDRWAAFRC